MSKYSTPAGRWKGIGPYYAMFPADFADKVILDHTKPGDAVLDPFAGRGTAAFSAASNGRAGLGIEINPLGYVYSNAKLRPAALNAVQNRLETIAKQANRYRAAIDSLPEFFHLCFGQQILSFLLSARANLDWRRSNADRILMAIILVNLHGKRGQSLSNQMRQTASMSPDYCVRWWREKRLTPPAIDPVAYINKRLAWRYEKGAPAGTGASVRLGDNRKILCKIAAEIKQGKRRPFNLLLTSPPYCNVTSYYQDQWLRFWMLGEPESPSGSHSNKYGGKFASPQAHKRLLTESFSKCAAVLKEDAAIYVRTDRREPTFTNTLDALKTAFPDKRIETQEKPLPDNRKTKAYSRGGAPKQRNCEVDILMTIS